MAESYASMRLILDCVKYGDHMWKICCDFKVVAFLNGMQSGNTKYPCHICSWDSRYHDQYNRKEWPNRSAVERKSKEFNIVAEPLVPFDKILLPPLHIKLGLFKNYIKFMQRNNNNAKDFLSQFFQKLSAAKLKEGILCNILCNIYIYAYGKIILIPIGVFVGPDIRRLMNSNAFEATLSEVELKTWRALKNVTTNFLGKHRSGDYEAMVQEMLDGFDALNVNMSLKIHFMNSHLDIFARQLPTESDEQGERFHQVCKPLEVNYKGKSMLSLVSDLCWTLTDDGIQMKRKRKRE